MARSRIEIKKEITLRFMSDATLANLYGFEIGNIFENIFSKVSIENIIFDIISFSIWTLEILFDKHKSEITSIVDNNHYGNHEWYNIKAKEFQLGDDLIVAGGIIRYSEINESKRIIKYSATVPGAIIQVKVAREDSGHLSVITNASPEFILDKIQDYFNKIKPFGTKVSVTSNYPDKLKIIADVYVNPLLLNNDGTAVNDINRPVDIAINAFLETIEFNGKLNIQKLTDSIQGVNGVEDIINLQVWAKYGENEYTQVTREYYSYAGWMIIDIEYPLEESIHYLTE